MMILYWSLLVPVLFFGGVLLAELARAQEYTMEQNRMERRRNRERLPMAVLSESDYRRIVRESERIRRRRRWGRCL